MSVELDLPAWFLPVSSTVLSSQDALPVAPIQPSSNISGQELTAAANSRQLPSSSSTRTATAEKFSEQPILDIP
jgi:hypothetical protein